MNNNITKFLIVCILPIFFSCNDGNDLQLENKFEVISENKTPDRLNFVDEASLAKVTASNDFSDEYNKVRLNHKDFVSLMDNMPTYRSSEGKELTFSDALGLDTLIHNPNFARLLNSKGELQVGHEVIRVTPLGTYRYPVRYEHEFNEFINAKPDYIGDKITEDEYRINDQITFYKTFEEHNDYYTQLSDAEIKSFSDNCSEDDPVASALNIQARAASGPDFNSFTTFKADRKTVIGKIIQNLIGASKTHTLMFESNDDRKLQGTFYF